MYESRALGNEKGYSRDSKGMETHHGDVIDCAVIVVVFIT